MAKQILVDLKADPAQKLMCEACGLQPATRHETIMERGVVKESHLCESCAKSLGLPAG